MSDVPALMEEVRKKRPLVHHITNYVTVNDCANITICAGGAPVMTDGVKDVEEMVRMASAFVINIGTLNERTVESMVIAGKAANAAGVPVILDPVGAGATKYRTETAERILREVKVDVIKGNAGEISILAGLGGEVRGVDSGSGSNIDAVRVLAQRTGCVVGMTGPKDYVSDGKVTYELSNGSDLLGCVSGTGCMVSSVTGCYVGANGATAESVAAAISVFSIAGEIAAEGCNGPGTFKSALLDALFNMKAEDIEKRIKTVKI